MTRIFRGKISRKIQDFFINPPNFSGNFAPKNSSHDADWDTIRRTGSPEIEKIDFLQIFQLFITKFLLSYLLKLKGFFGYLKSSPLLAFEVVFEEGSWSWWPPLGSRVRVDFDGSLVVQAWSRLACFWSRSSWNWRPPSGSRVAGWRRPRYLLVTWNKILKLKTSKISFKSV